MPLLDEFMHGLFYMKQPINIINRMKFHEMKYWYGIHEMIQNEYKKQTDKVDN